MRISLKRYIKSGSQMSKHGLKRSAYVNILRPHSRYETHHFQHICGTRYNVSTNHCSMDQKQESTLSQKVKGSVVNQERQTGHLHFFPMNTLLQRSVCFHGQKSICSNNVHFSKMGIGEKKEQNVDKEEFPISKKYFIFTRNSNLVMKNIFFSTFEKYSKWVRHFLPDNMSLHQ